MVELFYTIFFHYSELSISYKKWQRGVNLSVWLTPKIRKGAELVCLWLAGNDKTRIDVGRMGLRMADIDKISH